VSVLGLGAGCKQVFFLIPPLPHSVKMSSAKLQVRPILLKKPLTQSNRAVEISCRFFPWLVSFSV